MDRARRLIAVAGPHNFSSAHRGAMTDPIRLSPGLTFAAALVASALAADVALLRRGHPPISTAVRGSKSARLVTLYLAVHLTRSFRWDPLTLAGAAVERRYHHADFPRVIP